jgi:HEPN domain-containing protein
MASPEERAKGRSQDMKNRIPAAGIKWYVIADSDRALAKMCVNTSNISTFDALACYHTQQAMEKYLKGMISELAIDPPKTHEILFLFSQVCESYGIEADEEIPVIADKMSFYEATSRYPGMEYTDEDVRKCISYFDYIADFFKERGFDFPHWGDPEQFIDINDKQINAEQIDIE